MEPPILFDPKIHTHLVSSFVTAHMRAITEPTYMVATFLPPLSQSTMQAWWEDRVKEVVAGTRHIIMQMVSNATAGEEEVAGVVMLSMSSYQTVRFNGDVEKLIVLPEYRRMGITKRMMAKLEEVAKQEGRVLLMLDTEKGSPAEFVYPKLGYVKVGEIPNYMVSPLDGSLKDAIFFYKDLR